MRFRSSSAFSLALALAALGVARGADAQQPAQGQPVVTPAVVPPPGASTAAPAGPSDSANAAGPAAKPDAAAAPATGAAAPEPHADEHVGRFEFGSYGRVYGASDLRGGTGRGTNVVAFGPRIVDEGDYAELELRREDVWGTPAKPVKSRIVTTLALFPPFFHFSGKLDGAVGVRNLYAQGTYEKLTMWAGSRMYRGDDIYLLNWWPLDNQNTIGGGVGGPIAASESGGTSYETVLQAHVGQQRLDNPFQFQEIPVVAPFGFGTVNVTKLDRPRTIETLKATEFVRPTAGLGGFKVILYGELHELAAGTYRDPLTNLDKGLPADTGFLIGSQLTYWTGARDTYVSLVMRHARNIAAYDPLAAPITFAVDRTTSGASETQVAVSGNYETETFGLAAAGYVRFFRDGSPAETSTQKYDEGTIVARPSLFFGDYFGLSFEGSYQQRRIAIVMPDASGPLTASVAKFGVMPYFSPSGRGTFKRPQIRLLYVASLRDSGARALYPTEDVFSERKVEHFLGIGAEWWFNSSSYP